MRRSAASRGATSSLAERGIEGSDIIAGLKSIARAELPTLFERYEQVWHW
jgi:hypothetical protein